MDRLPKGFQHVQESLVRRKAIATKSKFEVDEKGLARLMGRRGKQYAALEIVSNAIDEAATHVNITLEPLEGERGALFVVEDDNPEGFKRLSDAWTLFAPSLKAADPKRRGRFNFGEKFAIALSYEVSISTTTGAVLFDDEGRHVYPRRKREFGSVYESYMKLSRSEITDTLRLIRQVILPLNVEVTLNKEILGRPKILRSFKASLPTERWDDAGDRWIRTKATDDVHVYEVRAGEKATLFELGIPVVETGDEWHYDVRQRVLLNMERDNVTPSYLQDLRTYVVNAMVDHLTEDNAKESWVKNALEDPNITSEAVTTALDKTVGERRVMHSPNDPEASELAFKAGYTVVYPGHFNKKQHANIRRVGAIPPATQVTPSGKTRNPFTPALEAEADAFAEIMMAISILDKAIMKGVTGKELARIKEHVVRWTGMLEGQR